MTRKSGSRPERIGNILQERIRTLGWEPRLREEEIYACWEKVVGPQVAAHARPSHIANRRLTVVTESPVWAQQLTFLKTDLLRRILARIGPDIVTELYFVAGHIPATASPPPPDAPREDSPPVEIPADIEREVAAIADDEVQESVRRLCRAAIRRRGI